MRAEYAQSKGHKIADYNADGSITGYDKTDAWYIAIGAPLCDKCKVYAKWDVYREGEAWGNAKALYCLSANYYFNKNLKLQANYNYTRDKMNALDGRYNNFDLQLYWRF